jgi:rhodanese-related sulfurtransferase
VTAPALAELLALSEPPLVLDVRSEREWRAGHIEDSLNIPLAKLSARLGELPRGRRLAVHCQSGYRSSIASSLLLAHGITGFHDLVGGFAAWQAARLESASA